MKTAFVTGGNRGIGFELVKQLLSKGYHVHTTYRTNDGGLADVHHERLTVHQCDVRDECGLAALFDSIHGGLDLLINNAGVSDGRWSKIEDIDFEHALEVMEINALAPMLVLKCALPALRRAPSAKVVMMSSLMASIDDCKMGKSYVYRASKTALNMLTVASVNELRDSGIAALLIHPGWVETDMGGPNAPVRPYESVKGILERIEDLSLSTTGSFIAYDGQLLPW